MVELRWSSLSRPRAPVTGISTSSITVRGSIQRAGISSAPVVDPAVVELVETPSYNTSSTTARSPVGRATTSNPAPRNNDTVPWYSSAAGAFTRSAVSTG